MSIRFLFIFIYTHNAQKQGLVITMFYKILTLITYINLIWAPDMAPMAPNKIKPYSSTSTALLTYQILSIFFSKISMSLPSALSKSSR